MRSPARLPALLTSVLALALTWLLPVPAAAQATVGVDPVARIHTATPGQTITQTLTIYNPNPSKQKVRVVAYLSDMNVSETGETEFPPAGTLKESSAAWTTFTPAEIELGGEESKQVRYTVQVPADATPGTHWAMLMFEAQEPAAVPGKTLASFRLRVAHTMYINVQPTTADGSITGIFDALPKNETGFYQIAVQYTNTGNVVTGVQGRVELRGADGNLAATLPLDLIVALPGRNVLLKSSWLGPVPRGQYSALVVLNNGDRSRDILGEHVLTLPFDLKAPPAADPAPSGAAPASAAPASTAPATGTPALPTPAPGTPAPGSGGTGGKP